MPLTYLSSDLVTSIRNLGTAPGTEALGNEDADLLRWASEGVRSFIFPKIVAVRGEYGIFRTRTTITGGVNRYRLPHRAAWQNLRDLWLFTSNRRNEILPLPEEHLSAAGVSASGQPYYYLIEGNDVVLLPDQGSYSGQLEFVFYCRPGDLVLETSARQIPTGGINTSTKTVTFATAIPSTWATTSRFDVHSQYSGAELKMLDEAVTVATGTTLTFSQAIDGTVFGTKALEAGDWVCLTGDAVLPAVPAELHPQVARVAVMQMWESLGDSQKVDTHAKILDGFLKTTLANMKLRVQSRPRRIGSTGRLGVGSLRWRM